MTEPITGGKAQILIELQEIAEELKEEKGVEALRQKLIDKGILNEDT